MKKAFLIFIINFFVLSCAINHEKIANKASEIGYTNGMKPVVYQTKNFKIFTLQKINDAGKPLRVYIEGDGKAFINKYTPSLNPTPTSYFLVNLIAKDPSPNIIYIARPCQYVIDKKCQQKYWTTKRFSPEVVYSVAEVLEEFPEYKLELIGYSGGGAIAKYVTAINDRVINFRSIAGNLDEDAFTKIHNVSGLNHINLNHENLIHLQNIPQIHFIGSEDKIIPKELSKSYLKNFSSLQCIVFIEAKDASHSGGWKKLWPDFLKIEPTCVGKKKR